MTRRIALVFPGQGSQHPGMLDAAPAASALPRLLDAAEALSDLELRTIATLGTAEDLADTRVAQPLLYLCDWAWGSELISAGMAPAAVAGHSLGEIAALAVAGVFSVEAGLELVVERSRFMGITAQSSQGGMLAVIGMDAPDIARALESLDDVWVANDNTPGQVVVSGRAGALPGAGEALLAAGARRVIPLPVSGAFHSPLMEPARSAFETLLAGTAFSDAHYPVLQNTDPTPTRDGEAIRSRLTAQITAPVRWTETMAGFVEAGIETVVEAGPGSVLTGLARRFDGLNGVSAEQVGWEAVIEEVFHDA